MAAHDIHSISTDPTAYHGVQEIESGLIYVTFVEYIPFEIVVNII